MELEAGSLMPHLRVFAAEKPTQGEPPTTEMCRRSGLRSRNFLVSWKSESVRAKTLPMRPPESAKGESHVRGETRWETRVSLQGLSTSKGHETEFL